MTIRPIIFSAPMVRALLDGRKSQTRRLATSPLAKAEPGDLLYVREAWGAAPSVENVVIEKHRADWVLYRADGGLFDAKQKWHPSIHMPRWASRLTLEVQVIRGQRLQAITNNDAIAEGIYPSAPHRHGIRHGMPTFLSNGREVLDPYAKEHGTGVDDCALCPFRQLWNDLHHADPWEDNPRIVALTFRVHKCNVDQMAKEMA